MQDKLINAEQLIKLQVMYGQLARGLGSQLAARDMRLRWASDFCGRPITSFKEFTRDEARRAIDHLGSALGQPPKPKRMSRDQARRAALDGRRDGAEFASEPQLANAADLEAIERLYGRLGWSREQFDGWLRSPRSPIGRHSNPQLRTAAQANRVRWALKSLLKKKGLWEERPA